MLYLCSYLYDVCTHTYSMCAWMTHGADTCIVVQSGQYGLVGAGASMSQTNRHVWISEWMSHKGYRYPHTYVSAWMLYADIWCLIGSMVKRTAVHLDAPVVARCLGKLPVVALRKGCFCEYGNLSMKKAPTWDKMQPYVDCLKDLLNASKGRQVLQSSMLASSSEFVKA